MNQQASLYLTIENIPKLDYAGFYSLLCLKSGTKTDALQTLEKMCRLGIRPEYPFIRGLGSLAVGDSDSESVMKMIRYLVTLKEKRIQFNDFKFEGFYSTILSQTDRLLFSKESLMEIYSLSKEFKVEFPASVLLNLTLASKNACSRFQGTHS